MHLPTPSPYLASALLADSTPAGWPKRLVTTPMISLTEQMIRNSFVNASRKEVSDLTLPLDFSEIQWDSLDYFGWRDRKLPRRSYVVVPLDDSLVGIVLRQTEAKAQSRPQCSWCQDVNLSNDVAFYSAKRAGDAGRKGDTVGTLVCAEFGCSVTVRKRPPLAYVGFDVDAAREARIAELQERARSFALSVVHGASSARISRCRARSALMGCSGALLERIANGANATRSRSNSTSSMRPSMTVSNSTQRTAPPGVSVTKS
ncbi:FBP domain-containing protein [Leifsonia poae]|uniref:FBP domain-containing protein n=1 Tax=Leifsonia poae TaxID=110933 RepID=UPI003D663CE7